MMKTLLCFDLFIFDSKFSLYAMRSHYCPAFSYKARLLTRYRQRFLILIPDGSYFIGTGHCSELRISIKNCLILNSNFQAEVIRSTNPSGKNLAVIVSRLYQNYVLPESSDQLPFEVDKSLAQGMQDCMMGNKSPVDFFTVQKQVNVTKIKFLLRLLP